MKNTVLIAVGMANVEPWKSIWEAGQNKTWVSESVKGVDVIQSISKSATNSSSYIIKKNLLAIVQDFDKKDNVYAGFLMPENQKIQFVSGAGRLLSRSCVELIVKNWRRYSHNNIEDVCLGNFLRDLGVRPVPLNTVQVPDLAAASDLRTDVLASEFHFRCKGLDRERNDIEIMTLLHKRISNIG